MLSVSHSLGRSRGKLIGGNLSVFTAMIGSSFLSRDHLKGAILFLEGITTPMYFQTAMSLLNLCLEVGEEPYRIDRFLTQMQTAGFLDVIAGFVFGRYAHKH